MAQLNAQTFIGDTVSLEEVLVKDDGIDAGPLFREQEFDTDSLVRGRATLAEALRNNTTLFVRSYGVNGVASISLRGTSAQHTRLYWNNLDIGSPMLGMADLSLVPVSAIDQMSIQYGFASLNDGSGGIGGSIRLNNSYRDLQENLVDFGILTGSFGQRQSDLELNLTGRRVSWQFGASYFETENNFTFPDITEPGRPEKTMENAEFRQSALWSNLYYRLNRNQMLSLKTWYTGANRKLPPLLTGDASNYDALKDDQLMAVVEYRRSGDASKLLATSGMVYSENDFTAGSDSNSYLNSFLSWQNSLRYQIYLTEALRIETGGRFRIENARSLSYASDARRVQSSLFADLRYQITDNIRLSLLLREEWIDENTSPLLGAAGINWKLTDHHRLRLHLARNYRYPSLNDLYWNPGGNQGLLPETSYNFEVGYGFDSERWPNLELAVFHNIIDNWIQWIPRSSLWTPVNLRKVANTGVEFAAEENYKFGNWQVDWRLNYTYISSRALESYELDDPSLNQQLPYVPSHRMTAGIEIKRDRYWLRYDQQLNGKYYTNRDHSVYMPFYAIGNFALGVERLLPGRRHQLSASLLINNIFDYPYQILPYRPEPGINWAFRVRYCLAK